MKNLLYRSFCVILLITSFSIHAAGINVDDPWVRAAPPNAPALGVFMKLENHSAKDIALSSVSTSLASDRVELHRTTMVDGMMKMTPQKVIPVMAHSATMLKPGSWHIMIIKPKKVPQPGDSVQLTLVFDDGSEQSVTAAVRKGKKMMMKNHGEMMKHD